MLHQMLVCSPKNLMDHMFSPVNVSSLAHTLSAQTAALCSLKDAIDSISTWHSGSREPTSQELADQVLQHARDNAVRIEQRRIVTAAEPGLEVLYSESLRNERVPVAAVSPINAEDWSDTCATPVLNLNPPLLVALVDTSAAPKRVFCNVQPCLQ